MTQNVSDFSGPKSLWSILCTEWNWWIPGAIFSFLLASVLMSGWPTGLIPNLAYPYTYQGDGLSHSWLAQRAIEGWIFDNPRSGYPFGSNFLDYPGSDSGSLLILKGLGVFTSDYSAALNLFFLLSFPSTLIASFVVLRSIGLSAIFAVSSATLFVFIPFHFQRLEHLFYTWYFVVPLFFYVGFRVVYNKSSGTLNGSKITSYFLLYCGFIVLASFGVYYAIFGIIILGIAGLAGWVRNKSIRSVWSALGAILVVIFGVLINLTPNLINKEMNGLNLEVAVRSPAEAEIYGLKLMQLIYPRLGHRDERLATLSHQYSSSYPLVNENSTATLGAVGTAGFFLLGLFFLVKLSGGRVDARLSLLTMMVIVLFLFGTIGGLGALFSATISSSIRGWNRISVFIAFGTIAALFLALQIFIKKSFSPSRSKVVLMFFAISIVGVGLYDQTVPACQPCNDQKKLAYALDRDFVQQIESSVPTSSAIYQLPYMPFPEIAPLYRLGTYDLVAGFLHSKSLHWSYAGMKGREGDLFYRSLAKESIGKQLDVIKRLGFSGIYIDRRGVADNAQALIERLSVLLDKPPLLTRADGKVVFFQVEPIADVDLRGLSSMQIMQKAGYVVDRLGTRYPASFVDGIDFTRQDLPEFVQDVTGLSGTEPWGRWSDANLASSVRIDMQNLLPNRFDLVFTARPFGPNLGQDLKVRIGTQIHHFKMQEGMFQYRKLIDLAGEKVSRIEFLPPQPISPQQLGINADSRKLGVGLIYLGFLE